MADSFELILETAVFFQVSQLDGDSLLFLVLLISILHLVCRKCVSVCVCVCESVCHIDVSLNRGGWVGCGITKMSLYNSLYTFFHKITSTSFALSK